MFLELYDMGYSVSSYAISRIFLSARTSYHAKSGILPMKEMESCNRK
jgi:hypothetical protein